MSRVIASSILVALAALASVACTGSSTPGVQPGPSSTASPLGPRPSSPAALKIVVPKNGSTVVSSGAEVQVSLERATLVDVTSQDLSPTEGHLHVYVDDDLISMTSGLRQSLPDLEPGRHVVRVEFVAADHAPFEPRVLTQAVFEAR
jgi:hypothetical protein